EGLEGRTPDGWFTDCECARLFCVDDESVFVVFRFRASSQLEERLKDDVGCARFECLLRSEAQRRCEFAFFVPAFGVTEAVDDFADAEEADWVVVASRYVDVGDVDKLVGTDQTAVDTYNGIRPGVHFVGTYGAVEFLEAFA